MVKAKHGTPTSAAMNGILDLFKRQEKVGEVKETDRLDGKRCLVTGASSGLGKAVAVELARRGGKVVLGLRSGIPETGEEIKEKTGNPDVEMIRLDLADLSSVRSFCDEIKNRGIRFDRAVFNAGVVPGRARRTVDGYEEMFQVNYLGKFLLLNRLLADGSIPNTVFAGGGESAVPVGDGRGTEGQSGGVDPPRIVFTSSEVHRTPETVDFSDIGRFHDYGMKGSMQEYGYTKLLLTVFFKELARRLSAPAETPDSGGVESPDVSVFALCPGPVNSRIARDAPKVLQPLLRLVFSIFFKQPSKAAEPVVYFCCSSEAAGKTGMYLHLMTEKETAPLTLDPENGRKLWEVSEGLVNGRRHSRSLHHELRKPT